MRKLLRIEWLLSKTWLLYCGILYVGLIIVGTIEIAGGDYDESVNLFALLPVLMTNVIMCRALITFDADKVARTYKLLPARPRYIVGSKFIFINLIYIILFVISLIYQLIIGGIFPEVLLFSWTAQLLPLSIGIFLINFILLGYYLLGAGNIQVITLLAFLCIFFGMKYLAAVPATFLNYILPFLTIALSILFYNLASKLFITDVFERTSFLKRFSKKGA